MPNSNSRGVQLDSELEGWFVLSHPRLGGSLATGECAYDRSLAEVEGRQMIAEVISGPRHIYSFVEKGTVLSVPFLLMIELNDTRGLW
jgi:hypothetical protein